MPKNKFEVFLSVCLGWSIGGMVAVDCCRGYTTWMTFFICALVASLAGIDFWYSTLIKHLDGELIQLQKYPQNYDIRRIKL